MIPCQRDLFDIPDAVAYFNCAYIAPNLKSVRAAGEAGVARKSTPWNIHYKDFHEEVETVRGLFALLIGAQAGDVAVIPAASYGAATAAANLAVEPGDRIVFLENQHPSNIFPWREMCEQRGAEAAIVAKPEDDDWTTRVLDAIDERTAIVALPNCHWSDGTVVDLVAVGQRYRTMGAALVVDATQSAGAMPIDVKAVRPDFMFASGYKWLMCPYALSFLYVAPERQAGRPLEANTFDHTGTEGGQTWQGGTLQYPRQWAPGARRFDMGERANFALMPMAAAALEQVLEWGIGDINRSVRALTDTICDGAARIGFAVPPPTARSGHLTGLRFPGGAPTGVQDRLAERDVYISMRGDTVRVSPHLWVNQADVDRLLAALAEVAPGA
ncbi:MAG: aminotransferase class V-fold PLP-dependent enzyme [Rhodospirillales bacterium]|jgi:selenocysteine lyase/cysteine desulfurase|nr:aminotransferase class V-fold PLP-dependent enzyme [Rhodospirillales bacterium]